MLVFDIETESLPLAELQRICEPFDPSSLKHPGKFDPDSVKLGRMTDQTKIDAKIQAEREKHDAAIAKYESDLAGGEEKHWAAIADKAALYANTGSVCAIGYLGTGGKQSLQFAIDGMTERTLLLSFWKLYRDMQSQRRTMVGWNIHDFDIPFLVQRSYILALEVPADVLTPTCYVNQIFVDLMKVWKCGSRTPGNSTGKMSSASIDTVVKACGLDGKPSDCTGANFARMLRSSDEADRKAAESYLSHDLVMCEQLAERFGVQ